MRSEKTLGAGLVAFALLATGCSWDSRVRPVEVVSAVPDAAPRAVAPLSGLVSWYQAEGNANDAQGAHPGVPQGGLTYGAGMAGLAFSFDGVDDYVDLGDWFVLQTFSIGVWVKPGPSQLPHADILDNNHNPNWHLNHTHWGALQPGACCVGFALTPGVWQYLVVTRDNAHVSNVYRDGVLLGSTAGAGPLTYSNQFLRISRWGGGGRYWNGLLDELEIYDRVLTPTEITTRLAQYCGPEVTTPPASATRSLGQAVTFSVTATGTGLSYQWKKGGVDISGATGASYTIASVSASDAGAYTVALTGSCGTSMSDPATLIVNNVAGQCFDTPSDLISWWRGEGDATDAEGLHHGATQGGATFGTGLVGQAFSFDGVDDYVDLGSWFDLQTFSIAAWVKAGSSQAHLYAAILDNNHTDFRSWSLQYDNVGSIYHWGNASGGTTVVPTIDFSAGQWQHVVITRDVSHKSRVYLDGALFGSAAGAGPIAYDGSQFLRLSHWGGGGRHWNGQLDEIEIYSRALSGAEIQSLFTAGSVGLCSCAAPTITTDPTGDTKTVGEAATFSVTATGDGLSYQWKKDGVDIPGATTASHAIASVVSSDAGEYTVAVTGSCGVATSEVATLGVNPTTPNVTAVGGSFVYDGAPKGGSGAVTGIGGPTDVLSPAVTISYLEGATPLSGAPTDAGSYTVVASFAGNPDYLPGMAQAPLTIAPAAATVTLSDLGYIFDGTPKQATAATTPPGLQVDLTYNGSATPPSQVGDYSVGATINERNYAGSASGTLTIAPWTLQGFYSPVDMSTPSATVYNTVKGGSTVPLKFEVFAGANERTDTWSVASFTSTQLGCLNNAPTADIEFVTTGGTSLRYDAAAGQFIQNWKTPQLPGHCFQVTMTTQDGSRLVAYFLLK